MALNANNAGGPQIDRPVLDAGTYPARSVQVIDLGLQAQRPFQGQEKPPIEEILLTYEFVDEFMLGEDGEPDTDQPRWLSERMPLHNLRSERAKSTKRYLALDPHKEHAGDFSKLLDIPCSVTIVQNIGRGKHEGKVFENIANVAPMRQKDADKCPELVKGTLFFDLDEADIEKFAQLPQWIQDVIKGNLNWEGSKLKAALSAVTGDAAPVDTDETEEEHPF